MKSSPLAQNRNIFFTRPLSPEPTAVQDKYRPDTPLDFIHSMHRRIRISLDSERVLDTPKGVTQAFPDDGRPMTPLIRQETRTTKMGSWESTRSKLKSFSLREKTIDSAKSRGVWIPRQGMPAKTSSLAVKLSLSGEDVVVDSVPFVSPSSVSTLLTDEKVEVVDDPIVIEANDTVYPASITSTQSSEPKRHRVMGRIQDPNNNSSLHKPKTFIPQSRNDVLPFASDHPFSAWDPTEPTVKPQRRPSLAMRRMDGEEDGEEGVSIAPREKKEDGWNISSAGKRSWIGDSGVYKVGWEREILDLSVMIQPTYIDSS